MDYATYGWKYPERIDVAVSDDSDFILLSCEYQFNSMTTDWQEKLPHRSFTS